MPGLMQNVIVSATPDPAALAVRLVWKNGSVTQADFSNLASGGAFAALSGAEFFRRVEIADDGHVLTWPGELEFDADALWFESHPEDMPIEAAVARP